MSDIMTAPPSFDSAMVMAKSHTDLDSRKLGQTAEAAKEFEAMFISEMLTHMFEGIDVDPEFGGGKGEEMFQSMMVGEYGKMIAKAGGLGISDMVQKAMIEMQEKQQAQGETP